MVYLSGGISIMRSMLAPKITQQALTPVNVTLSPFTLAPVRPQPQTVVLPSGAVIPVSISVPYTREQQKMGFSEATRQAQVQQIVRQAEEKREAEAEEKTTETQPIDEQSDEALSMVY